MTIVDTPRSTSAPDAGVLLKEYRAAFVPAARAFLDKKISAVQLRTIWRPYYMGPFLAYDFTVVDVWRRETGTDGGMESGHPAADPAHEAPLKHFPVSIAHNNLDRLIEVLAIELGDRTVETTEIPERLIDFAHVVDALDALMESLAE